MFIIACGLIVITAFVYPKYNKENIKPAAAQTLYDATASISKAMSRLQEGNAAEADIIKDVKTSDKVVALAFQGLSDTQTNKEILKLLKDSKRKASFFIPGISAAEDEESVTAIYADGHKIESNTLLETKHLEKFSRKELVEDFCNANSIIQTIVNENPEILLCNATEYTPELLQAAYASGNQKVLKSTHYLNYQSFRNYEQVAAYINKLEKGSILTFKMSGVLDKEEYEPAEREETPAIDKAPGIEKSESTEEALTEEERLLSVVRWVLKALDETNYQTVYAEDLSNYYDMDYVLNFNDIRKKNNGKHSEVYKKVKTDRNRISFSFRGIDDEDKLNEILDFLEFNHLSATFFVTADDILRYPENIQTILDKNQTIANGGMTGKDLTTMDFNEICLEIYKCDKLLMEKYLINSNLFMPAYGKYNDVVLEAASSLGYKVVTYNKVPLASNTATLDEVMNKYQKGYSKGDIIYFNISYKQLLNVITQIYASYIKDTFKVCDIETLIENSGMKQSNNSKSNDSLIKLLTSEKADVNVVSYIRQLPRYLSPMRVDADKIKTVKAAEQKQTAKQTVQTAKQTGKTTTAQTVKTAQKQTGKAVNKTVNKAVNKREQAVYTKKELEVLRKKNKNKKAQVINTVHTTEQALSFTFYGVGNKAVTNDVLSKLDSLNAKATFFVTEKDLKDNAKVIKKIADKGHEIGICLIMPEEADFYSVTGDILTIQSQVKKLCGKKPDLVRYAYNVDMTDEILEAVSSTGCKVIGQDLALTSSRLGADATLEDINRYAFNSGNVVVKRGYIIFIRMDFYQDPALVGNLILAIVKNRIEPITFNDGFSDNGSAYTIKTLGSLLNSNKVYNYPLKDTAVLPAVKNAIYPGHLLTLNAEEQFEYMKKHYTGNPFINTVSTLPGFTSSQVSEMDQTGRFTYDKVLFLTFDDWGSDKPITQILYVLNKYKVKATFFVRTSYVQDNPNLLRAIAEAGHAVGSHTDKHLPFANSRTGDAFDISTDFTPLTYEDMNQRKGDLLVSYNKLQGIIGDIEVNGMPSLTKILRPPTLAMSKEGMETIFDMGFQYIVSGDYSTHDYAETDSAALADHLVNGLTLNDGSVQPLTNGSIFVMHMSDDSFTPTPNADITAQALDMAIPRLLAQGYKFARLSDYLPDNSKANMTK
jgi:peptidoglycan/xylan/chitin deacetylase (PgdA/CDA1 family)